MQHTGTGPGQTWKQFISPAIFNKPGIFPASAWAEHIPFAFWLIESLKPDLFVELGTHYGLSYFTFCEAVQKSRLKTKCYAVDNWTGDEHAGFYDGSVFDFVSATNEQYSSFSTLYKLPFDEAIASFDNKLIDLLHIDGLHTYDAVKHDFYNWLPKISDKGIVLFHDTHVMERGFGVNQLWEELTREYPSFEFTHGYGLGILGVGKNIPRKTAGLFEIAAVPARKSAIQKTYERLGMLCRLEQEHDRLISEIEANKKDNEAKQNKNTEPAPDNGLSSLQEISIQVFWKKENEIFNQENSAIQTVCLIKDVSHYTFEINQHFSTIQTIRIDPASQQGVFYLHSIAVTSADGQTLMDWEGIKNASRFYNQVMFKSTLIENAYVLISISIDPIIEIYLPKISSPIENDAIHVIIGVSKIDTEFLQQELSDISIAELKVQ